MKSTPRGSRTNGRTTPMSGVQEVALVLGLQSSGGHDRSHQLSLSLTADDIADEQHTPSPVKSECGLRAKSQLTRKPALSSCGKGQIPRIRESKDLAWLFDRSGLLCGKFVVSLVGEAYYTVWYRDGTLSQIPSSQGVVAVARSIACRSSSLADPK